MNKHFFYFGLAAILFAGCSKDKTMDRVASGAQDVSGNIKVISYSNGLKTGTTMLDFESINAFESTLNRLNQAMRTYDSTFYAQYGNLSEEAYDAKQTELSYNDQTPLIDFETTLSFSNSMRQVYVTLENSWLANTELNLSTYPKKEYPFSITEMTLLNSAGEVKIGNCILKLTKNGYVWITDGNFSTLTSFNNGDMSVLNLTTVKTNLNETSSGDCASWKGKDVSDPYASSKKVIKHVHHHSYPWKWTESSEITSYKHHWYGWAKYAIDLGVSCQSYFKTNDCAPGYTRWSDWKREHQKSIEKNNTIWGAYQGLRAENGASVFGNFEYAGYANGEVLTW